MSGETVKTLVKVLAPAKVCASVETKPGFVPSAAASVKVLPLIEPPLALVGVAAYAKALTPPELGVVQLAKPTASDVNTLPNPGVPPVILI